jgi:hypothetical protein
MGKSPKHNEEIIDRAVNALSTIAPDAKFNNLGLVEVTAQAERCMTPRRQIAAIATMKGEQIAVRETEDEKMLKMIDKIVLGILNDERFGEDSALYEAFGYVRKSKRKSGLLRKKKSEVKEMP